MIGSYTPGQSLELVPNPHYGGVPAIPKQNVTVVIDWVKTPDIALLMLQDGQADSASFMPPSDYPAMQKLQAQGLVNIYDFPTVSFYDYTFNIEINKGLEANQFGTGFNEPSNYFADLPTRLAWINAYDYAGYLNNILGNAKYGTTFGTGYVGVIPAGEIYSPPPALLGGLPVQNLDAARGNFSISAWAGQTITLPIVVQTGDPVNLAGAEEWAATLAQISNGKIIARVVQLPVAQITANQAQGSNPMAVYYPGEWIPDYPDPSDVVDALYQEGGVYASGNNWGVSNFASLPPSTAHDLVQLNGSMYTQAEVYSWMNGNITLGNTSTDSAVRQGAYTEAERLAVALGLYVYVYQVRQLWYWRSWLKGYDLQENPVIGGGAALLFYWLRKGG